MCAQRITSTGAMVESRYTSNKRVTSIGVMVEWRPVAVQDGGAFGSGQAGSKPSQPPAGAAAPAPAMGAPASGGNVTVQKVLTAIGMAQFGGSRRKTSSKSRFSGYTARGDLMQIRPIFRYPTAGIDSLQPTAQGVVMRYSHMNIGGPDGALIRFYGDEAALWSLATGYLKYRVELQDDEGRPVWWGYVNASEYNRPGWRAGVSLESMWNSIIVHYNAPEAGGTQAKTSAASDPTSVTRYGTRSMIDSGTDISTLAAAEYRRDRLLNIYRYPVVERERTNGRELYTDLYCLGYWHLLDWVYHTDADSTATATTTQASTIITAANSLFTAVDIKTASGVSISEYQDGNATARQVVEDLLKIGTSGGGRLRAYVTSQRRVVIDAEPTSTDTSNNQLSGALRFDQDDRLRGKHNELVPLQTCPVGVWVQDNASLAPRGAAALSDPGAFFVERSEYNCDDGTLQLQPRGQLTVSDLVGVQTI